MKVTKFFAELKRRNVYRAAVLYGTVAWLLTEIATQVFPFFNVPNAAVRFIVVALSLGFPIAMLIAWLYELTPEGFVRTEDVDVETQRRFGRKVDFIIIGVLLLVIAMLVYQRLPFRTETGQVVPEKSIAVLPFENLSESKENAFFATGVQDQILSYLAQIADLKVISRTSVTQYRNAAGRSVREIARQLGVAHVLEGTVQRVGDTVRVSAQLIDARKDAHEWAEKYDRPVGDVFAIQSEIAKAIAEQLRAHISLREQAAISKPPTTDLVANQLYIQAKELIASGSVDPGGNQKLLEAARLLEDAVRRDPDFLNAYCLLGQAHLFLYFEGFDHTPARRELAHVAIEKALRLKPDAGEAHLALARYSYHGFEDYDRARSELNLARRTLPNDPEVYLLTAFIDRRQGRWNDALGHFERAIELDPRNVQILRFAANTYTGLRRYSESSRLCERALTISPDNYAMHLFIPFNDFLARADLGPWRDDIFRILGDNSHAANEISDSLFDYALAARDPAAMTRALAAIPPEGLRAEFDLFMPREWYRALAASAFGDTSTALASFTAARTLVEDMLHSQPDYATGWSVLGLIDANLGRKDGAMREGRHACDLLPLSMDAWRGPTLIQNLAVIYAKIGENDRAIEQLRTAAQVQNGVHYGELKLNPQWDALRSDARFQEIVGSLAPK